jgi:hypothetical protein
VGETQVSARCHDEGVDVTLFEVIVHLILWPFNAAVYTYSVLAVVTGSEPPINLVIAAGVIVLLLGSALTLRRRVAG